MPLLTQNDYPAIRAALDVGLSAAQVPDALLAREVYHPAAEAEVLRRLPVAEGDLTDAQRERARRVAMFLTAALLAGALPTITQTDFADLSVRRQVPNAAERAATLRAQAEVELAALIEELGEVDTSIPVFFTLAPGYRGR